MKSLIGLISFVALASSVFGVFVDSNTRNHGAAFDSLYSENYIFGVDVHGRVDPSPGKWGSNEFGTGASVTWSFMGSGLKTNAGANSSVALSSFLPLGFEAEIQRAFDSWSRYVDIEFIMATDPNVGWQDAGADAVDIRITGTDIDGERGILANSFYPPSNGGAAAGDIHFDVNENWKIGFGGSGFNIYQVMTHEIGHAIGLAHSDTMNSIMYEFYSEAVPGLQWDDVMGARAIYGARNGSSQIPNDYSTLIMFFGSLFPAVGFKLYLMFRTYFSMKKKRISKDSLGEMSTLAAG